MRGFPAVENVKCIGTKNKVNPVKLILVANLAQAIDHIGLTAAIQFQGIQPEFGMTGYCQFNHLQSICIISPRHIPVYRVCAGHEMYFVEA